MQDRVSAYIDKRRDEMVEFLRQVVDIYSPTSDAAAVTRVGDIFAEKLASLGFSVRRVAHGKFGAHVLADLDLGASGAKAFLMGHMDTVEVLGDPAARRLKIDGDIARGLGTVDMKGGIVSMLYGLEAMLKLGERLPGSIRVFLNADEEPGSPTSRPMLPEALSGVTAAIVCEGGKTGGGMIVERKGCGVFRLKVTGRAAHAGAEPEKGASAIRELMEKAIQIENLKQNGTTVNCGVISGGTAAYVIPEYAEAAIDFRVPTVEERLRVEQALKHIAQKTIVPGTTTVLEGEFHRPPAGPVKGTAELKAIVERHAASLGQPIHYVVAGGVGDINNITDLGVPAIDGFGPEGAGAHATDEYIDLPTLFSKAKLIALSVRSVLSGELNPQ